VDWKSVERLFQTQRFEPSNQLENGFRSVLVDPVNPPGEIYRLGFLACFHDVPIIVGADGIRGGVEGSGANCFKCMFLSGEKTLQILSGQDSGPNVRSAG
jgi:hypothetical protein